MQKHPLRNLARRLPRTLERQPRLDQGSRKLHDELREFHYTQPYDTLAQSIEVWERCQEQASEVQAEDVLRIITEDAHDLATRVLDEGIVDLFELKSKRPDDIAVEHVDAPPLRALHLLLHAYDITGDPRLRHAVEYILYREPPQFADLYREAYEYSTEKGVRVIPELRSLAAYQDDMLDEMQPELKIE